MKNYASKNPVTAFSTPPGPPPDVAEAISKYDRVTTAWGETRGLISDTEEDARKAKATAKAAAVEAAKDGIVSKLPDIASIEAKYARKLEQFRANLDVLSEAADSAGNDLAVAIEASRDPWIHDAEQTA